MQAEKMKFSSKNKQGGFSILGVILVVVAIVGALGIWAMSGQTNTSNASTSTGDIMASSISNDGLAIKTSFDTLLINGAAATSITFIPADTGVNNILNPTTGLQTPTPSTTAVINSTFPNGAWIYKSAGFKGNGIGTVAADQAVIVPGVKDGVCQHINHRQHGTALTDTIPESGLVNTAFTTGALAATPSSSNAADISAVAAVAGWMSGCVSTTTGADNNVYFAVMKSN